MNELSEFEPIHTTGHLDVGDHQRYVGSRFEDCDSFVCINGLNRGKAGVLHHVDSAHTKQHFVLNDENDRSNGRMPQDHHEGAFHITTAGPSRRANGFPIRRRRE